jgi:hypothetical protein
MTVTALQAGRRATYDEARQEVVTTYRGADLPRELLFSKDARLPALEEGRLSADVPTRRSRMN